MGIKLAIWNFAYALALFKFEAGPIQFILAFLLCDFMYYVHHYLNHKVYFLWSMHQAHHTSLELNLATGARVSWLTPYVGAFLFTPIALLGIDPIYMLVSLTAIFYGKWWCHTRLIGRLEFLEKFLNTPSLHRVHHSSGPQKMNNFAGFLCIWDRIFGTYKEEEELITKFGTSRGFVGYNPFIINLKEFFLFIAKVVQSGVKVGSRGGHHAGHRPRAGSSIDRDDSTTTIGGGAARVAAGQVTGASAKSV